MIYFISGHRDLEYEDFKKYYIPTINRMIKEDENADINQNKSSHSGAQCNHPVFAGKFAFYNLFGKNVHGIRPS